MSSDRLTHYRRLSRMARYRVLARRAGRRRTRRDGTVCAFGQQYTEGCCDPAKVLCRHPAHRGETREREQCAQAGAGRCPEYCAGHRDDGLHWCARLEWVVDRTVCARCRADHAPPLEWAEKARAAATGPRRVFCRHGGTDCRPHRIGQLGGQHFHTFECSRHARRAGEPECWTCPDYEAPDVAPVPARSEAVLVLRREGYRVAPTRLLEQHLAASGFAVVTDELATPKEELVAAVERAGRAGNVAAVLRWEEHGSLFASRVWRESVETLYRAGVVPLAIDWGYLAHYDTVTVDRYLPGLGAGGASAIRELWPDICSDRVLWDAADPRLRDYWDRMQEIAREARAAGPLEEPGYVCIWQSFSTALARPPFRIRDRRAWIARACKEIEAAGARVVVKRSPVVKEPAPDGVPQYEGRDPVQNARLALYARDNLLIASSVSNELVAWGVPVCALGRSWHTGLGVFREPADWAGVVSGADVPAVDQAACRRWLNWWLGRQAYPEQAGRAVADRIAEGRRLHGGLDYASLYADVYARHGRRYRMGRDREQSARSRIEWWEQRNGGPFKTALDVGCGQGEFARWLLGRGTRAVGCDVVRAPGAEGASWWRQADARRLPWDADSFELATCLDVLEHLEEEHARLAVAELCRVGRRVYVETRRGPAAFSAGGDWPNLHRTDRDGRWWRECVQRGGGRVIRHEETGAAVRMWVETTPAPSQTARTPVSSP